MAGTFTVTDATIGKGKIFPALINKLEIRAGGEASDQYQSVGRIANAKLDLKAASQKSAGGIPSQVGYTVEFSADVLASGTDMRTALNLILSNFAEARMTDVNGHKFTFAGTTASTAGEIDLTISNTISGDGEGAVLCQITGAGYITAARFTALYAES